jgi:hypothetical protein
MSGKPYRDSVEEAAERARAHPVALRDLPQDSPIKLPVLARAMKLRTQTLRRRLRKIHMKQDEPVLVRIGNQWAIASINRLRQVWHGIAERGLTVEELTEQLVDARARESAAQERNRDLKLQVMQLRARMRATETRMVEIEHAFERATRVFEHLTPTELERPTPGAFLRDEVESGVHVVEGVPDKRSG